MHRHTESVEALQDRLRRLETAIDVAGLGLWEWDLRSNRLTWNEQNSRFFGVPPGQPLTIQDYVDLVHPEDRKAVLAAYRKVRDRRGEGDYVAEHRTAFQPGGKARWLQTRGRLMEDADGLRRVVGSTIDITDRKMAEERRGLILRELEHRAKNGIMIMMTLVAQTARNTANVADFKELLTTRLRAMADSQDLVTRAPGRSLPLTDLLDQVFTPFGADRFDVDAALARIEIPSGMVVAMALLLHELSTNSVKYGALSVLAGRVKLSLAAAEQGRAVVDWVETGGPPVKTSTRRGFGSRLLEVSLRNNGGHVESRLDPMGFQARIHFPTEAV